ncbi:hypothetical protein GJAV_G00238180 [Gymnothorax javanicus]|nr:hypothetical protein GJAV_G00238180 [Gymnothorax javanicus]
MTILTTVCCRDKKKQSAALDDGLSSIAWEVRAVSNMARALRRDTRAIGAHTKQLVSAVSGLTMAINTLARGVGARVQAVVRSFSGPRAGGLELPGIGEGGQELAEGVMLTLCIRKVTVDNVVCIAKRGKSGHTLSALMFFWQQRL